MSKNSTKKKEHVKDEEVKALQKERKKRAYSRPKPRPGAGFELDFLEFRLELGVGFGGGGGTMMGIRPVRPGLEARFGALSVRE